MMKTPIYYWIDHTAKCPTNTGMQRLTRYLGRSLLRVYENVVFVRWDYERKSLVLADQADLEHLSRFNGPEFNGLSLERYPSSGEIRLLHETPGFSTAKGWLLVPEVTHITFHPEPPTLDIILYARHYGLKSAFIFYDAVPLKLVEYAASAESHALYMQHLAIVDVVIPISKYSAEEYINYLTDFVYFSEHTLPTIRPIGLPGEMPNCERAEHLAEESNELMILSVGTVEPRKNQVLLMQAFDQLCMKHPELPLQLLLVGNLHPSVARHVQEAVRKNHKVRYLSYVDDLELVRLYRGCTFTVYPSLEEGFGLPILESLWHGKPCICANFGAMHEVAQEGGCLEVDVRSAAEIMAAMEHLALDARRRRALTQEALNRNFKTWDEYAFEVTALLQESPGRRPNVGRILYLIHQPGADSFDSSRQRLMNRLAKSLIDNGTDLVPVKWDAENETFVLPTHQELERLVQCSGSDLKGWTLSQDFGLSDTSWLLVPYVLTFPNGPDLNCIITYAASIGLRSAVVLDGATESELAHSLSDNATALQECDLVLAMSEKDRADLLNYLFRKQTRLIGIDDRILSVGSPDEGMKAFFENRCTLPEPNDGQVQKLAGRAAISRSLKAWQSYTENILMALTKRSPVREEAVARPEVSHLYPPLLSVCVTTYNRAAWLAVSLKQLANIISPYGDVVELVVCDNASSDHTESVVHEYSELEWFRYVRNPVNVGMLGNLRETVHHARGRFVWLLGDDDIVKPGSLEKILSVILEHPFISLIYLNYAYTHHSAPSTINDIGKFISSAIAIAPATEDRWAPISEISTLSENFFTAIYCLIFRRDHAIKAYSQDTTGRPFSSLLTCIPTASYVCTSMIGEMGYWVGCPSVVVNLNVSWMKYASLWRLERLPELYELTEMRGASPKEVDRWRVHNLQGASRYLHDIYFSDPERNRDYFSFERFIRRHKHLSEFRAELPELMRIYAQAYDEELNETSPTEMLERFGLSLNVRNTWLSKMSR